MTVVKETLCTTQLRLEVMITNAHTEFNFLQLGCLLLAFFLLLAFLVEEFAKV